MRVSNIYSCLSGEGLSVGVPMVLLRLQGCSLRCHWCDTPEAQDKSEGIEVSVKRIIDEILIVNPNTQWLLVTGGEPLLQSGELQKLLSLLPNRYKVEVETSGFYPVPAWAHYVDAWVTDYKCPSSGQESKAIDSWIRFGRNCDSIKFVVGTEEDLEFVLKNKPETEATILVSPMIWDIKETNMGEVIIGKEQIQWIRRVAQFCQKNGLRLSLQNHKLIFGQERRDV